MDLTPQSLRDTLHQIDCQGWNNTAGRDLLDHVRRAVVLPVVRASGLRGPAADQAEASGWEAAWDALRRPTARTAANPGGMVWTAVRRAVWAEVGLAQKGRSVGTALEPDGLCPRPLSLDQLVAAGWQLTEPQRALDEADDAQSRLVAGLIEAGWDRSDAADAIAIMADEATRRKSGTVATRWRWVALRLGVPEWRARRLAVLLLGVGDVPGVVQLVAQHGTDVLQDGDVHAAFRSTTRRWSAGPGVWLSQLAASEIVRVPA